MEAVLLSAAERVARLHLLVGPSQITTNTRGALTKAWRRQNIGDLCPLLPWRAENKGGTTNTGGGLWALGGLLLLCDGPSPRPPEGAECCDPHQSACDEGS